MNITVRHEAWFNDALSLYNAGLGDEKIASALNCNRKTVAKWRTQNGLASNRQKSYQWREKALDLYKKGFNDTEIAKMCKVNQGQVYWLRKSMNLTTNGVPGLKHGAYNRNTKLYYVWRGMIERCESPNQKYYSDYGGRGIKICYEWKNPNCFMDWALCNGFEPGLQIDRIDNDGNYEPENCRWVTSKENNRNRRDNVMLTVNGITLCTSAWSAEKLGLDYRAVNEWVRTKGVEYAVDRARKMLEG